MSGPTDKPEDSGVPLEVPYFPSGKHGFSDPAPDITRPHITRPAHYDKPGCNQWALGDLIRDADVGFDEGNVMKYMMRHGQDGGADDVHKAMEYCRHILRRDYGEED